VVWSRGDALVPGARQLALPGADVIMYPDLGHLALLASRRVARTLIERLSADAPSALGQPSAAGPRATG
jgi:hypothetical protein